MQDKTKTKAQLIKELAALRQQVAQLQAAEVEHQQLAETLQQNEWYQACTSTLPGALCEQKFLKAYRKNPSCEALADSYVRAIRTPLEHKLRVSLAMRLGGSQWSK